MKPVVIVTMLIAALGAAAEAPKLADKAWHNLWTGKAPGALGDGPEDTPAVQVFLPPPSIATGASFVVCPGGGYGARANHEGPVVGEWLAKNGITAFVLRYRLGAKGYKHPIPLGDAQRAIRFVRTYAREWNLDPARIGIMGFSAGGHLTSTAATHYDAGKVDDADIIERASCRPDAHILIYPVVTFGEGTHRGSRKNLLGDKENDPAMIELLSNEKHVNEKTSPAFVVHTIEDKAVPISNSDNYVAALKKAGVEHEYVREEKGQHGFGLKDFWTDRCIKWLRKIKF